jgi:hypothetical protein
MPGNAAKKVAKSTRAGVRRASAKPTPAKRPGAKHAMTAEERACLEALEANKQVQCEPGPLAPGVTHVLEPTPSGKRVLKRKRFSAV